MALDWDENMGLSSEEVIELQSLLKRVEFFSVAGTDENGEEINGGRWMIGTDDYGSTGEDTERLGELLNQAICV